MGLCDSRPSGATVVAITPSLDIIGEEEEQMLLKSYPDILEKRPDLFHKIWIRAIDKSPRLNELIALNRYCVRDLTKWPKLNHIGTQQRNMIQTYLKMGVRTVAFAEAARALGARHVRFSAFGFQPVHFDFWLQSFAETFPQLPDREALLRVSAAYLKMGVRTVAFAEAARALGARHVRFSAFGFQPVHFDLWLQSFAETFPQLPDREALLRVSAAYLKMGVRTVAFAEAARALGARHVRFSAFGFQPVHFDLWLQSFAETFPQLPDREVLPRVSAAYLKMGVRTVAFAEAARALGARHVRFSAFGFQPVHFDLWLQSFAETFPQLSDREALLRVSAAYLKMGVRTVASAEAARALGARHVRFSAFGFQPVHFDLWLQSFAETFPQLPDREALLRVSAAYLKMGVRTVAFAEAARALGARHVRFSAFGFQPVHFDLWLQSFAETFPQLPDREALLRVSAAYLKMGVRTVAFAEAARALGARHVRFSAFGFQPVHFDLWLQSFAETFPQLPDREVLLRVSAAYLKMGVRTVAFAEAARALGARHVRFSAFGFQPVHFDLWLQSFAETFPQLPDREDLLRVWEKFMGVVVAYMQEGYTSARQEQRRESQDPPSELFSFTRPSHVPELTPVETIR